MTPSLRLSQNPGAQVRPDNADYNTSRPELWARGYMDAWGGWQTLKQAQHSLRFQSNQRPSMVLRFISIARP